MEIIARQKRNCKKLPFKTGKVERDVSADEHGNGCEQSFGIEEC